MLPLVRALHALVGDPHRVDAYYAPVARGLESRLARAERKPLVVGVQGPQGSGKTTLASALVHAFGEVGLRAVSVSIDDFYLTHGEQAALAQLHAGNRCLAYRGYPGTHDVALGRETLATLLALGDQAARVPTYDKSAQRGRGDRAPIESWRTVRGPFDLVLVEGWMLGFSPVDEATLPVDLRAPNHYLAAYADWPARLDAFVHLDVRSLATIVTWRVDSERARRARGETALGDDDARDYILRCLPAYRVYVPRLSIAPPCADFTRIVLGEDRMPERGSVEGGAPSR
jgi:D-glycerate 3-kinase